MAKLRGFYCSACGKLLAKVGKGLQKAADEGVIVMPKSQFVMPKSQFVMGDTVVWNPKNFNPDYWNNLSEEDRIKYYGALGYGQARPKHFVFICHHRPQHGHCVLFSMTDQKIETMRHTSEFDLVDEDDC